MIDFKPFPLPHVHCRSGELSFKYIYFNHMNLAQKTSIHADSKKVSSVPPDVLKLIADLNNDLSRSDTSSYSITYIARPCPTAFLQMQSCNMMDIMIPIQYTWYKYGFPSPEIA